MIRKQNTKHLKIKINGLLFNKYISFNRNNLLQYRSLSHLNETKWIFIMNKKVD